MTEKPRIAFFGTPEFAVIILDELEVNGFTPSLIIAQEDKPAGRGHELVAPATKKWAEARSLPVYQPRTLKDGTAYSYLTEAGGSDGWDLFIVASYGKIIPEDILNIPRGRTLNVHPSLLPKFRGPSPIHGAILSGEQTGVSIMRLDAEMDHGPIVAQEGVTMGEWPCGYKALEDALGRAGGILLARTIPGWLSSSIPEREQDHDQATYTRKVLKDDAVVNLADDPMVNLLKVKAYEAWPRAFGFFEHAGTTYRLVITDAPIEDGAFVIKRVIPEGRKEMLYEDFLRGLAGKLG
jgi:methionyl-tRNA formyltransferase